MPTGERAGVAEYTIYTSTGKLREVLLKRVRFITKFLNCFSLFQ